MLYECSCSFTAESATAFYKHLAKSKEGDDDTTHQLVQAKFTEGGRARGPRHRSESPIALTHSEIQPSALKEEEEVNTVAAPLVSKALAAGERFNIRTALDRFQAEDNGQEAKRRSDAAPASTSATQLDRDQGASDLGDLPSSSSARASGLGAADADSSPASSLPPLPISRNADISSDALGRASSGYSLPPAASAALQAGSSLFGMMVQGMNPLKLFGLVAFENKTSGEVQRTRLRYSAPSSIPTDQSWGVVVPVVEDVLMWKEPWQSAKVFGMGLYVLLCYSQLSRGSELLQPSTALLFATFVILIINIVRNTTNPPRGEAAEEVSPRSPTALRWSEGGNGLHTSETKQIFLAREQDVYDRTTVALNAVASVVIPYTAATVSICYRALSGRRLVTSVLVAVVLWSGMVLGELRVTSQVVFCALSYIGFFTLPACYVRSRVSMDSVVEDLLRFIARAVVNGSHSTAILGGITFLAIVIWAPLNIVLRTSLAVLASFALLVWRLPPLTPKPVATELES